MVGLSKNLIYEGHPHSLFSSKVSRKFKYKYTIKIVNLIWVLGVLTTNNSDLHNVFIIE